MQNLMLRLDGFVRRRRPWIIGIWAPLLLATLPLAARQSETPSGGGFTLPGSQSAQVNEALERTPGAPRASLALVLVPDEGARPQQLREAVDRIGARAPRVDKVALAPDALRTARAQ